LLNAALPESAPFLIQNRLVLLTSDSDLAVDRFTVIEQQFFLQIVEFDWSLIQRLDDSPRQICGLRKHGHIRAVHACSDRHPADAHRGGRPESNNRTHED
jgi:hypothetical protein